MNFEEVLHLDVRVKSNLDKLLLCVEGLTELIYLWGQAS